VTLLAAAQLLYSLQAMAGSSLPFGDVPERRVLAISADYGPTPFAPARSESNGTTTQAAANWAAPDSSLGLVVLPSEIVPIVTAWEIPRSGFPPGFERPPKSSF
jgi:hypothetical protein